MHKNFHFSFCYWKAESSLQLLVFLFTTQDGLSSIWESSYQIKWRIISNITHLAEDGVYVFGVLPEHEAVGKEALREGRGSENQKKCIM